MNFGQFCVFSVFFVIVYGAAFWRGLNRGIETGREQAALELEVAKMIERAAIETRDPR